MFGKTLYAGHVRDSQVAHAKSLVYDTKEPVLAMAAAPDRRCLAYVSKSNLKVLRVDPESISMKASLKLEAEHLPTALTWGSKLVLGTSAGNLSVLHMTETGSLTHSNGVTNFGRPVNSLHMVGQCLLCATSDGVIRVFDLRLRLKHPVSTWTRHGDIVRECQFARQTTDALTHFAVIYDSGLVFRYDLRHPGMTDLRINAHQQGLTLNWHPDCTHILTGGRDKLLHVWDMAAESHTPVQSLRTPMAIARARWLPIQDCAPLQTPVLNSSRASKEFDSTIWVWSLTSPYCPMHVVEKHNDLVTEICPMNSSFLWSSSRDGTIRQHDLREEPYVAENLSMSNIAWQSPRTVVYTSCSGTTTLTKTPDLPSLRPHFSPSAKSPSRFSPSSWSPNLPSPFSMLHSTKKPSQNEELDDGKQGMVAQSDNFAPIFTIDLTELKIEDIEYMGERLLFQVPTDMTRSEACRKNASILEQGHLAELGKIWRMLALALEYTQMCFQNTLSTNEKHIAEQWFAGSNDFSGIDYESMDANSTCGSTTTETHPVATPKPLSISLSPGLKEILDVDYFAPQKLIREKIGRKFLKYVLAQKEEWQLVPMIRLYVKGAIECGSILNAAALLLVFQDIPNIVPRQQFNEIKLSCLEIVQSKQCFVAAARLRAVFSPDDVMASCQLNTALDTICNRCHRPLSDNMRNSKRGWQIGFWYCGHCRCLLDNCSFCARPVKGLAVVNFVCGHRTHRDCWDIWERQNLKECPAGCGELILQ